MPTNYSGSSASFPATVEAPDDGEPRVAASVDQGFQDLANRTAYLKNGDTAFAGDKTFANGVTVTGNVALNGSTQVVNLATAGGATAFTGTKTFTSVSSMGGATAFTGAKTFTDITATGIANYKVTPRNITRVQNIYRYDPADWAPSMTNGVLIGVYSSGDIKVAIPLTLPQGTITTALFEDTLQFVEIAYRAPAATSVPDIVSIDLNKVDVTSGTGSYSPVFAAQRVDAPSLGQYQAGRKWQYNLTSAEKTTMGAIDNFNYSYILIFRINGSTSGGAPFSSTPDLLWVRCTSKYSVVDEGK